MVTEAHATLAAQLVLAHRALYIPSEAPTDEEMQSSESPPDEHIDDAEQGPATSKELDDVILEATLAAIPRGLLSQAADFRNSRGLTAGRGKDGPKKRREHSGRPVGTMPAERAGHGSINLLATLKAALPWQTLRRAEADSSRHLYIKKGDLQATRFKDRNETTTVFVVDASGSQAAQRLGEVKGAIELLLSECYVRRDQVALIVFRGAGAEVALAPTRALVQAKKKLAAIPAGGGTPLAAGIDLASEMVESIRRQGRSPRVVFLTDGRANISRDGSKGHAKASDEALLAARMFRATGLRPIVVDSSRRPRASAAELAESMQALYLPMPYANAAALNTAISRHATT